MKVPPDLKPTRVISLMSAMRGVCSPFSRNSCCLAESAPPEVQTNVLPLRRFGRRISEKCANSSCLGALGVREPCRPGPLADLGLSLAFLLGERDSPAEDM